MPDTCLDIQPETCLDQILEAFPAAAGVLHSVSPRLAALVSPALRQPVLAVTTVRRLAEVEGAPLSRLLEDLRAAAGHSRQPTPDEASAFPRVSDPAAPDWLRSATVVAALDARPFLAAGVHPAARVMEEIGQIEPGQAYQLTTPFPPAPLVAMALQHGYVAWSHNEAPALVRTYFGRT